ncbi:MAG: AmmeMemoRadiSam system protein B [Candidatus Marinimicrobia bacterium]|nr:AmmeMemoRadiSam system protein B [Candidatus Neomarinimicrobiota bacterium]
MKKRKPVVAGQFYPGGKTELEETIDKYFEDISVEILEQNEIMGIIAPHAGYIFSGFQAAKAYKNIIGRSYDTVCVISPSHQEYFEGCSVYSGDTYETPLGEIKINSKLREKIDNFDVINISDNGHHSEHALEVQLPFIQRALSNSFSLIPIVVGSQNDFTVKKLSEVVKFLRKEMKNKILFVASSDLSHFHDYETAEYMDKKLVKLINDYDYDKLWKKIQLNEIEACGGGPITSMMMGLDNITDRKTKTFGYMNSGDVIGDKSRVVGYTSAVIYK